MNRILDLQKLAAEVPPSEGNSTSSWAGCTCSTSSNTGCSSNDTFIAI